MRTTVLQHTLPDGSSHFDWLMELDPVERPRIPTFRVSERPHDAVRDHFDAERLPDHRRRYLDYSGPLSRDRGSVKVVAMGTVVRAQVGAATLRVEVSFDQGTRRWDARCVHGSTWRFWCIDEND